MFWWRLPIVADAAVDCFSCRLFGNRAFCFERLQEYEKALTDAELSLSMCPGWVKGLFRKGRALVGLKVSAARRFTDLCLHSRSERLCHVGLVEMKMSTPESSLLFMINRSLLV